MSTLLRPVLTIGLALGLLPAALEGATKPAPEAAAAGCPTCDIVYTQATNYTTGPQDLVLIKKDGTSKTTLLAGSRGVFHKAPSWAPDGQWIGFSTNSTSGNTLRVIKSDGTGSKTLATRCTTSSGHLAWRPVPSSGGYWLVYYDARGAGGCLVTPPSGYTTVGTNLWAVHVSLGSPVLVGSPVCLTCALNPLSADIWWVTSWSRDGAHLSSLQQKRGGGSVTYSFQIFDVSFGTSGSEPPALVSPGWSFSPMFDYPRTSAPVSWAHWSDSFVLSPEDATGKDTMVKYEIELGSDPKSIRSETLLTQQSPYKFLHPKWSPDDLQMVDFLVDNSPTKKNGIYVVTLGPPFSVKLIAPNSPKYVDSPDWKP